MSPSYSYTHTHTHTLNPTLGNTSFSLTLTHTHTHTLPGAWREGCSIYPSVHLCFGYQGALLYGQLIQGIRPASPLIQAHRKQKSQMRFLNSVSKCAQICQDPKVFVTTLIRKQTGKERKITKWNPCRILTVSSRRQWDKTEAFPQIFLLFLNKKCRRFHINSIGVR